MYLCHCIAWVIAQTHVTSRYVTYACLWTMTSLYCVRNVDIMNDAEICKNGINIYNRIYLSPFIYGLTPKVDMVTQPITL